MSSMHVDAPAATPPTTLGLALATTLILALLGWPIDTDVTAPLFVLAGVRVLTSVRVEQVTTALRALAAAASVIAGVPDAVGMAKGAVA